jgi:hypothetical protein
MKTTDDNIIRRMRFACWITKATGTHSEYVILIAFPRQQWLRERASMSRYMYMDCLCLIYVSLYRILVDGMQLYLNWLWYVLHIQLND